ncbi:iron-sulfur cluster assembly protein, mitochondrial [Raphidocelis subcapitata]|uniref:Iron-sulfur cluster assembly protein, mitochondrial n=1 Tax=Raphidocelis subcapitata TaxID=307507 RepID=A0A2V0NZE7_9CHLO|nr:iron-sulfur cluster assembly protein, mitochondrial [Raphidocelis subcapitata]|eukprot:GBF90297.1 iron-sulfur cluster assembly protein, mitochondrial [Raphidocelis subcapitata]
MLRAIGSALVGAELRAGASRATAVAAAAAAARRAARGEPSTSAQARGYAASADASAADAAAAAADGIGMDDSAVERLRQLQQQAGAGKQLLLRVEVEGGGCSGFQYKFRLDSAVGPDDRVFERGGARLVTDAVSLGFLKGAVIEYEDSLMRSAFQVATNPNSESTCGCGSSFVAKG